MALQFNHNNKLSCLKSDFSFHFKMMASIQKKAQCIIWLTESKSPVTVQQKHWMKYGKPSPPVNSIKRWLKTFMETGSVEKQKSSGQPQTSNKTVAAI